MVDPVSDEQHEAELDTMAQADDEILEGPELLVDFSDEEAWFDAPDDPEEDF